MSSCWIRWLHLLGLLRLGCPFSFLGHITMTTLAMSVTSGHIIKAVIAIRAQIGKDSEAMHHPLITKQLSFENSDSLDGYMGDSRCLLLVVACQTRPTKRSGNAATWWYVPSQKGHPNNLENSVTSTAEETDHENYLIPKCLYKMWRRTNGFLPE